MPQARTTADSVTVVGLGAMGSALARRLVESGHRTTVWNRSSERIDPLVAHGAHPEDTIAEALAASTLAIICVTDRATARELLEPVGHRLAGRALADPSSGTPKQARDVAAWVTAHGGTYVDGSILADAGQIGSSDALLLWSGPKATFDNHRSTFACFGDNAHVGDRPGLASASETALLGLLTAVMSGFAHTLAFARAEGADPATVSQVASRWITAGMSGALDGFSNQVKGGSATSNAEVDLRLQRHLTSQFIAAGTSHGLDVRTITAIQELVDRALAGGHSGEGLPALIEAIAHPSGTTRPAVPRESTRSTNK